MENKKQRSYRKIGKIVLIIVTVLLVSAIGLVIKFGYDNMNFDTNALKSVWKAGFEEKMVTLENGTILNYAEGPDNGPALLLIHGQTMTWQDYSVVLPKLSKYYHIFAVDVHGHGKSSHNPERYTCKAIGEDFANFIETVIKEPTVISGHSSGGIISTWIAAYRPDLVKGLIIEDSPFFSVLPDEMQNTFVWKNGFEIIHNFLNQNAEKNFLVFYYRNSYLLNLFGDLKLFVAESAEKFSEQNPGKPFQVWFIPHALIHGELYFNQYDILFGESFFTGSWFDGTDQADILSRVEAPTVYIKVATRYSDDGVLWAANSDEDAAKVESLLKNSETIIFKGTGHDVKYDDPKGFSKVLIDFLPRIVQ